MAVSEFGQDEFNAASKLGAHYIIFRIHDVPGCRSEPFLKFL